MNKKTGMFVLLAAGMMGWSLPGMCQLNATAEQEAATAGARYDGSTAKPGMETGVVNGQGGRNASTLDGLTGMAKAADNGATLRAQASLKLDGDPVPVPATQNAEPAQTNSRWKTAVFMGAGGVLTDGRGAPQDVGSVLKTGIAQSAATNLKVETAALPGRPKPPQLGSIKITRADIPAPGWNLFIEIQVTDPDFVKNINGENEIALGNTGPVTVTLIHHGIERVLFTAGSADCYLSGVDTDACEHAKSPFELGPMKNIGIGSAAFRRDAIVSTSFGSDVIAAPGDILVAEYLDPNPPPGSEGVALRRDQVVIVAK